MKSLIALVGTQFRKGAPEHVAAMKDGEAVRLIRERGNKFDRNAVAVWHGDMHVGYLKGSQNGPVARHMDLKNPGTARADAADGAPTMPATFKHKDGKWPMIEVDLAPAADKAEPPKEPSP